MGSVKDLIIESKPTQDTLGKGSFKFSDDYSVFDWGKMPDTIKEKGAVLCLMGAFNFEQMEKKGIKTHYLGVVENGKVKCLDELSAPSNEMKVSLTVVPELPFVGGKYDYRAFKKNAGENHLIPLEMIYRNSVPPGSSFRERLQPGDIGLENIFWPKETVKLDRPYIDFSTKLEEKDRYLGVAEAREMAGLDEKQLDVMTDIVVAVDKVITEQAKKQGFENEDGKLEMFYLKGGFIVADVTGTFDENRFSFSGKEISKEVARQYYKRKQKGWVKKVTKAKKIAMKKGQRDWKQFCGEQPKNLEPEFLALFGEMYRAGANQYLGKKWFEARDLKEVLKEIYER